MQLNQFVVDAFSEQPFAGNPAAVVPLPKWADEKWMQHLAAENNLSETAFIVSVAPSEYQIRWFTPISEIDLCGHATIASAHVVWHHLGNTAAQLIFHSASGPLTVTKTEYLIFLNFPSRPIQTEITSPEMLSHLSDALGSPIEWAASDGKRMLIEVENAHLLAQIQPNFERLKQLEEFGIAVTSAVKNEFVCRFFAPKKGINEDPVTGSAYTALIPHWHNKTGLGQFHARQLSQRGGDIQCEWLGDRVLIGGAAVTIYHANLLIEVVYPSQQ